MSPCDIEIMLDEIPYTPEGQCSYFTDRMSRSRAFRIEGDIPAAFYEVALNRGFRRCGDIYYLQRCHHCVLCLSYRVRLDAFLPTRSQSRVLRRCRNVTCRVAEPEPTPEKESIYLRYQYHQHYLKDQERPGNSVRSNYDETSLRQTMYFQLYTNPSTTREVMLYLDKRLIGFSIFDVAERSVSAVYSVFDPGFSRRSPGTLAILRGIEWARRQNYTFFHLGHFIPGHPKMDYKSRFRPAEIMNPNTGDWQDADHFAVEELAGYHGI